MNKLMPHIISGDKFIDSRRLSCNNFDMSNVKEFIL